jgi:hypothetical protein
MRSDMTSRKCLRVSAETRRCGRIPMLLSPMSTACSGRKSEALRTPGKFSIDFWNRAQISRTNSFARSRNETRRFCAGLAFSLRVGLPTFKRPIEDVYPHMGDRCTCATDLKEGLRQRIHYTSAPAISNTLPTKPWSSVVDTGSVSGFLPSPCIYFRV